MTFNDSFLLLFSSRFEMGSSNRAKKFTLEYVEHGRRVC